MCFMQDAQKRQGVEFQRRAFVRTSERTHDTHSRPLPQFPLSLHLVLGIRSDECLAFGEVYLSTYLSTYLPAPRNATTSGCEGLQRGSKRWPPRSGRCGLSSARPGNFCQIWPKRQLPRSDQLLI